MEHFDVVIIGAGPGGLSCAEVLGDSDLKVAVLEKNNEIGPKVCAGGLHQKTINYLNLPAEILDTGHNKLNLHINGVRSKIKCKHNFVYTVNRKKLGQWQLSKVSSFSNIAVRTNSQVSEIKNGRIVVDGKEIGYKYLVGADGSTSIVKRYLGIKPNGIVSTFQYIIPTDKYKDLEFFFIPRLFYWRYAWIFPHKGYTSIGVGYDPQYFSFEEIMENFKFWLNKKEIDISEAKYEAAPIDPNHQGYKFENVFLVGDAGGFASELTGEGIHPALVSGEEVAQLILNSDHNPRKIKKLLKTKRAHNKALKILMRAGKFRAIAFHAGRIMLKTPYLKNKMVDILT